MGIVNYELLSWENILSWEVLLVVGFAVVATWVVALRPRLFWPLLVASAIMGILPRIKGYVLADEILLGGIVLGGLMVVAVSTSRSQTSAKFDLHAVVFMLWMAYLIIETFRGVAVTGDTRLVRWVFLYGALVISIFLARRSTFSARSVRTLAVIALLSTVAVLGAYLGQGIYFDRQLGIYGRFLSGDKFVAGSAGAVLSLMFALPAAMILLRDPSLRIRLLAWATLAMTMAVAFYFDSRIAWLASATFLFVSLFRLGARRVLLLLALAVLIGVLYLPQRLANLPSYANHLYVTANALWSPGESDVARNLQFKAAFITVSKDWSTVLVGYGVNAHKSVIVPHILNLYALYLPQTSHSAPGTRGDSNITVFRTTAFSALLIDTGFVGMLLLALNLVLLTHKVIAYRGSTRFLSLAMVFVAAMWLLVINIQDVVLWYLLMMPGGLTEIFSRYRPAVLARRQEGPVARQVTPASI